MSSLSVAPIQYVNYQDWEASANNTLLFDSQLTNRISAIVNKLVLVSQEPGANYSIHVLNNARNFYCSVGAGHNIYISSAMLKLANRDEGELSALFAHEMAHAVLKHNVQKAYEDLRNQERAQAIKYGIIAAGIVAGAVTYAALNNVQNRSGGPAHNLHDSQIDTAEGVSAGLTISGGALVFAVLTAKPAESASRRARAFLNHNYTLPQELEADTQALKYLSAAGYSGDDLNAIFGKLIEQQNIDSELHTIPAQPDLGLRMHQIDMQLHSRVYRQ